MFGMNVKSFSDGKRKEEIIVLFSDFFPFFVIVLKNPKYNSNGLISNMLHLLLFFGKKAGHF